MRSDGTKGEGTALFVKLGFTFTVVDVFSCTFESVFIQTFDLNRKLKTIIGTIYRPPGTNLALFNKEFEKVIKFLTKSKSNLILLGDYNINLLNHEIHTETDDFLNLLSANTLLPLITKPTRYGDQSATLIDNIITNMYDGVNNFLESFWMIYLIICPSF